MYEFVVALARPYTFLLLVLLAAVVTLWCKRRETRGRLLLLTIPFAALWLVSTPMVAHLALGSLEWQYDPPERPPAGYEAIVVLAASTLLPGEVHQQAELADNTRIRCLVAAQLYRQGPACPIVVSGGKVDPDYAPTHAQVMAEFLRAQGVPAKDLIVEDTSRNTYENAVESSRELKQRGIIKVLLVVDAMDIYRAARCFARQGIDVIPAPSAYGTKPHSISVLTFVPNIEAVRNCGMAAHEWLGVLWYWCHGRI
jgi:uncharacterized SAM-binding protein YcdF (DUF218 family)